MLSKQSKRYDIQSGGGILDNIRSGYDFTKGIYNNTSSDAIATLKNIVPSSDENARPAYAGENHAMLYLPNKKYGIANYVGPGTQIIKRLERNDPPRTMTDATAKAHDIRYTLATSLDDIRTADKKMINKLHDIKAKKQDANSNINQGLYGIQSKVALEDMGVMAKDKFAKDLTQNYNKLTNNERELLKSNLHKLEQDGNGYTIKPADKLKLQVLKDLSKNKSVSNLEGGAIDLNVSGLLKKFMFGKENPSFGDVFNSFKDAINFKLKYWGHKNVVNPSGESMKLAGGSDKNYTSKKAGYVAKMIYENKLNKLRTVQEPSKSLKAMTKRRNKKGGAMFLAGGGIEDIDITALNKNILSLLFKDVFIPLMQKFKIDTTSTKFKMMTPIIINVLKLTVDKASNIQDLIKLLSDNFLNIMLMQII